MKNALYQAENGRRPERPETLPVSRAPELQRPQDYLADLGLTDAVNVALLLGQPLLLTGDPGTGKTQLAYSLAWQLGFDEPLKFETKSTSMARDLFYTYDALGRFQAAQSNAPSEALHYLTYHALGAAILRANEPAALEGLLPPEFEHGGRRRSVVLIDEVDKAPRDFPNDLLNELEGMYFRLPELGNVKVEAEAEMRPVVVMTSNSEKDLPDAFLRRCIYYNIPFPEPERLARIVVRRLGTQNGASALYADALELFSRLREPAGGLLRKPATAELLGWIVTLREMGEAENPLTKNPLADNPELALRTLSNLVKNRDDQGKAARIVESWIESRRS